VPTPLELLFDHLQQLTAASLSWVSLEMAVSAESGGLTKQEWLMP